MSLQVSFWMRSAHLLAEARIECVPSVPGQRRLPIVRTLLQVSSEKLDSDEGSRERYIKLKTHVMYEGKYAMRPPAKAREGRFVDEGGRFSFATLLNISMHNERLGCERTPVLQECERLLCPS